jgi:UDP-3-O-[3-hydroxymyristoyl] glucosamine N-acyltransferase
LTLSELARHLDCRLDGDGSIEITGVAGLDQAGPGQLTFFGNPKLKAQLDATRASAVIMPEDAPAIALPTLRTKQPYLLFAQALDVFHPRPRPEPGISPHAVIAADAIIGNHASIGPFVVIGAGVRIGTRATIHSHVSIGPGATIGDDCELHSHVAIREGVIISNRVTIQDGAVIGSDGFGYTPGPDGVPHKIPQVGTVVLEDDVEIGANTTIDRASVGETRIGAGTKIDNLVQVGHSVIIGKRVFMAAQVGLAGSTIVEDEVMLGGQVGAAGHLTIGKGAKVTAQSGISNSLAPGTLSSGYPAIDNRDWRKASIVFAKLPELRRQLIRLEERLRELEARVAGGEKAEDRR